ncbi:MAG: asparagine synthase-related protein, partial [Sphingomonadales bacterium]
MSGLCGWIEPPGPDGGGGEALSNMASGLLALEESEATAAAAGECALHLLARRGDGYVSADDDFLVAIAGRPYWTSPDSAATARELGHAEALRQAYLERGVDLFDRLHGGFALALIDRRERTAILAIDRVGVETMCFAQGAGGLFVFGSTTASVRRHPRISATIPMQAIYNYLCSWIIHAPATIYREQTKLRPGQYALYRGGRVETRFYWQMPYQESSEEDPAGLSRELLSVLRTATTRTIEGSDPSRLGAFLSGGLDSSTTVGLLTRINGAAKAFTIGFGIEKFDESPYARIAARHFGAEHYQHVVTPGDVADLIPRLAHYFDEPFG